MFFLLCSKLYKTELYRPLEFLPAEMAEWILRQWKESKHDTKNKAKNIKKLSTILLKSMAPLLEELKMTSRDAHKHVSLQRKHTF